MVSEESCDFFSENELVEVGAGILPQSKTHTSATKVGTKKMQYHLFVFVHGF